MCSRYPSFSTSAALRASNQGSSPPPPPSTTTTSSTVTIPSPKDLNAPLKKLKRYVALGRAYLAFYKTGLKNVYHNYRASLPLRSSLGLPAYLPISPPRGPSSPKHPPSTPATPLGRGQFQLVRRAARDVRRMIPFTLILIVCGEFTPLIVPLFGSAITPATCRVPGQVAKERAAASKRKTLALAAHARASGSTAPHAGDSAELELLAEFASPAWAMRADGAAVLRASAVFGLVRSHERTGAALLVGPVYRPRLRRYLEYLAIDDSMIRRNGGVAALSAAEVKVALDERGAGDVAAAFASAKAEFVEREWLERWLVVRQGMEKKVSA
ncbi:hypothetical protein N7462_001538 [Penicillium macrosclerotiorum]|uniref:uncharacterized protein n=1 Tax=Penicillium macrosclerotiorum TaxID=303699 RepID=UPI0025482E77|nr:uncharacterized protein N7462_001538 [Penicillium macrosclerotiorum]KAJ5692115.1 hypothetical protein N7462_001538 [Penicillium macrosclerotiorum]